MDVQRCCTRCYEKVIDQIQQRQTNRNHEEEEDDDNDESRLNISQNSKHNDGTIIKKKTFFFS